MTRLIGVLTAPAVHRSTGPKGRRCGRPSVVVLSALVALTAALAAGQETRGAIFGRILDPDAAPVEGAKVKLVNTQTNVTTELVSNGSGYYEGNLLLAGTYRVVVEKPGFKVMLRDGIDLPIGTRRQVDVRLELGAVTEQVSVTAEPPLLETSTVHTSQVIDSRRLEELPVPGGNTATQAKLTPGIQSGDSLSDKGVRLHSRDSASRYFVGGNVGGNEFAIDGIPNGGISRRIAYVPAPELVQEIKVDTGNFDASMGHSTGVNVAMMTKTGTNQLHGQIRWTHHQQRWEAAPYFTKKAYDQRIQEALLAGDQALANKLRSEPIMPSGRDNQTSVALGGPVVIPGLVNGKDKLFFFVGFTGFLVGNRNTSYQTVPTLAMREGNFSELLQVAGAPAGKYQIYDPLTVRPDPARPGHFIRDPFPGNIIPKSRIINPIYAFYNQLFPLPNVTQPATQEPNQNHITYASPYQERYYSVANRIDFAASPRDRLFLSWSISNWKNDNPGWLSDSPLGDRIKNGTVRANAAVTLDWVRTFGSGTSLDLSVSTNQYQDNDYLNFSTRTNPSDVGLPSYVDDVCGEVCAVPAVSISSLLGYSTVTPSYDKYRNMTGKADLFTVRGAHTVRMGLQARGQHRSVSDPGTKSGSYSFSNSFTRHYDDNFGLTQSNMGLAWAAFMMGLPDGATMPGNASFYYSTPYFAAYVQDAWRLGTRLTLNLGVRAEYELGLKERYNRAISTFDPTLALPITADAQTAYAARPIPELPAAQFTVLGGSVYESQAKQQRVFRNNFALLPKVSVAYRLGSKSVLSAGYGISVDTQNALDVGAPDATGFSRSTTVNPSTDFGMTWLAGNPAQGVSPLADPFPVRPDGNRYAQPVLDAYGAMGKVGRGSWTTGPYDREHARQQRWRVGVQQQIGSMVISAAYMGTYSDRINLNRALSYLPERYWADGLVRNDAIAGNLNSNVANPFYVGNLSGLATTNPALYADLATLSFFSSSTIQKNKLLRAYPQMNGIAMGQPIGEVKTHEIDVNVERRFSGGLTFNVAYTRLWARESFLLNEFDTATTWRPSNSGRPHRVVGSAIYELPFGKDRALLASGPLSRLLGGFQMSVIYEYQPGSLLDWGNLFYYGDLSGIRLDNPTVDRWFNTDNFETSAAKIPAAYHRRVFPTRIDGIRADSLNNWNLGLQRNVRLARQTTLQVRADLMNVFNRSQFSGPSTDPTSVNFGKVTSQPALSGSGGGAVNRWFQLTARVQF